MINKTYTWTGPSFIVPRYNNKYMLRIAQVSHGGHKIEAGKRTKWLLAGRCIDKGVDDWIFIYGLPDKDLFDAYIRNGDTSWPNILGHNVRFPDLMSFDRAVQQLGLQPKVPVQELPVGAASLFKLEAV